MEHPVEDLTGRSQFARNVLVFWGTQILIIVIGFIVPRQIDHFLGPASLGTWDLGWAAYRYLAMAGIGTLGVNRYTGLLRARGDIAGLCAMYSTSMILQAAVSLCVLIGSLVLVQLIPLMDLQGVETFQVQELIFLFCMALTIKLLGDPSRGVITGVHRWDLHYTITTCSDTILAAGMIVGLHLGADIGELGIIVCGSAAFSTLVRLLVMRQVCPEVRFSGVKWESRTAKELVRFGLKTMANSSSQLILLQTLAVLLASFAGPAVLAVYSRSYTLIRISERLLRRSANIFTPMTSSLIGLEKRSEAEQLLLDICTLFMALALPVSIGLAFFGDIAVKIWMGADYARHDVMLAFAFGSLLPLANTGTFSVLAGLNAHGRIGIASLLITIVGLGVLIPVTYLWFDIDAFSTAVILGILWSAGKGVTVPVFLKHRFGIGYIAYLRAIVVKPVLCTIPMIGLFYLTRQALEAHRFAEAAVAFVSAGLITVATYWYAVLPKQMQSLILARFAR